MITRKAKKSTSQAADKKGKDFLTEGAVKRLLDAAKGGRYGQRDYLMLLMAYRLGLRVSELIAIRLKDIDLDTSRLFVRGKKGSLSTHQPIKGDELRAIKAWLRERSIRPAPLTCSCERGPCVLRAPGWCGCRSPTPAG